MLNGSVASYSKVLKCSNPMDESIIMQPQFQQLEINGKSSSSENGTHHQSQTNHQTHQLQHQQQQQQQHTSSHHQPQNQRRRRNSSNSKNDMSPNKPTNGRWDEMSWSSGAQTANLAQQFSSSNPQIIISLKIRCECCSLNFKLLFLSTCSNRSMRRFTITTN